MVKKRNTFPSRWFFACSFPFIQIMRCKDTTIIYDEFTLPKVFIFRCFLSAYAPFYNFFVIFMVSLDFALFTRTTLDLAWNESWIYITSTSGYFAWDIKLLLHLLNLFVSVCCSKLSSHELFEEMAVSIYADESLSWWSCAICSLSLLWSLSFFFLQSNVSTMYIVHSSWFIRKSNFITLIFSFFFSYKIQNMCFRIFQVKSNKKCIQIQRLKYQRRSRRRRKWLNRKNPYGIVYVQAYLVQDEIFRQHLLSATKCQ